MFDLKYSLCLWNGLKLYFFHSSLASSVGSASSQSRDSYRQDLCSNLHYTSKTKLSAHTVCRPRALSQNEISPFGTTCNVTNAHITSSVSRHYLLRLLQTKANTLALLMIHRAKGVSLILACYTWKQ